MPAVILGILCTLAGCWENDAQRRSTSPDGQLIRDFNAGDNPFKMEDNSEKTAVEAVQLVIHSVTIARSDDSRRERIWQLLNPKTLSGSNQQDLFENGVQIASGGPIIWSKVAEVINSGVRQPAGEEDSPKQATVSIEQVDTWLVEGMVVELAVNVEPADQTLFLREPGKPLVGRTYENCYRLMRITGGTNEQGQVHISITPALKSTVRDRATVLRQRYNLSYEDREPYVAKFDDLAVNSTVRPGEFIAIGWQGRAGEAAFGGSFLHNEINGQTGTTVLLVFPRKVRHIPGKGFVVAED